MGNLLYWVASAGAEFYANAIRHLDLQPAHVAVLQVLEGEGSMLQARLSDKTRIDKSSMVGLLNELELRGLVERKPAPNDKRAFLVEITEVGRQCAVQLEGVSAKAEGEFLAVLTPEEQATLRTLLVKLAGVPHPHSGSQLSRRLD